MNLQPYPKYEDSGVEWIGEIPEGWGVHKLKFKETVIMGQSPDSESYNYEYEGYPFLQGNAEFSDIHPKPSIWCDVANKYALKNDILLSVRAPIGALNIADQKYGIGRGLCAIRVKTTDLKFLFYQLMTAVDYLNSVGTGSTYTAISTDDVMNLFIRCPPPLPTQSTIATFLDRNTTRIDDLITKNRRLIELLKEKRAALINHTVTKGLAPDAKMKDSGVELIGEIPEGWGIKSLRYLGVLQNGISEGASYFGSGFPFVSYGDIYNNDVLPFEVKGLAKSSIQDKLVYSIRKGDVFFTRTSETIEEIGIASTCIKTIDNAIFSGFIIRFRPIGNDLYDGFSKYFFNASFLRAFFVKEMNLVTRASLSQELLKRLSVILPPLPTQSAIASYLNHHTARIDKTISAVKRKIDLLEEYRKSLIHHVVTGKVDVREVEA